MDTARVRTRGVVSVILSAISVVLAKGGGGKTLKTTIFHYPAFSLFARLKENARHTHWSMWAKMLGFVCVLLPHPKLSVCPLVAGTDPLDPHALFCVRFPVQFAGSVVADSAGP